nr:integrase, catalytic region, zinc finger, CCHC-type, peptidase aspartic, catalytic [Tanacetum cinerariifolium]
MQMVGGNGGNQFRQYAGQNAGNQTGNQNQIGNGNLVVAHAEGNAVGQNGNQIRCYNCRGVEEYDLMAAAADLDEIEEVNANCILMANLQQASTSGTQTDSAPVYDTDGSVEVHENCDDNEIFNMFTQVEQYTGLLEPIHESHQVPQNDNEIISEVTSVEQAKFVGDFKYLPNEADASLAKHKALELEIERLLKAIVSQDIMIIVQNESVIDTSDLQIELEQNAHLKATYKNLFDSMSVSRAQTKTIIASLQNELQSNIYKNAKLRTQLFKKVSDQKDNTHNTSENTKFAKQLIVENLPKIGETNALSKPVTSNSVSSPQESKCVNNDKVITPGMFRINPSKTSREEKQVPNTVSTIARTKPITVSQPPVITKKDVNSNLNGLSFTGVDNTKTRRPQPRSNIKNDRVPSASKSNRSQNKEAKVEDHHRNLLLSKNNKHISSACNNIKIDSQDVISKVVCAMCYLNLCMVRRFGLFQAYDRKFKASHQFHLDVLGTLRFENDHVVAIVGFGDLQWGNILITRVYFIEGLGDNLFSVGQFCDSNLEKKKKKKRVLSGLGSDEQTQQQQPLFIPAVYCWEDDSIRPRTRPSGSHFTSCSVL